MGTSMTIPQNAQTRFIRKPFKHREEGTTFKLTFRKDNGGEEPMENCQNQENKKDSEQPITAVTEAKVSFVNKNQEDKQNHCQSSSGKLEQNKIQENAHFSIWQNVTEQARSHFRRASERRKKTLTVRTIVSPQQTNCKQSKQPIFSPVSSENKANDLALSVNSKITAPSCQAKQPIKKQIILPDVQIVKGEKERKKLKSLTHQEQVNGQMQKKIWRSTA